MRRIGTLTLAAIACLTLTPSIAQARYAGGDMNLYVYVGSRPVNAVDPSGLRIRVVNPTLKYHKDTLAIMQKKQYFAKRVMFALQEIIGDCAKLYLENKKTKYYGIGKDDLQEREFLQSAEIEYRDVKQSCCKNNVYWQDLKKAVDAEQTFIIKRISSENPRKNAFDPGTNTVRINPKYQPILWELIPSGKSLRAAPIEFGPFLWHELIGHGLHGHRGHPDIPENEINAHSDYYDPVIKLENHARTCLGMFERVHQYYGLREDTKEGDTKAYPDKPPTSSRPPGIYPR